jgi:phosphatidyl-myo-inositol dimannoside synthase
LHVDLGRRREETRLVDDFEAPHREREARTVRLLLITNDYPPKPGGIQQYLGSLVARFPGDVLVLGPRARRAAEQPHVLRGHWRFMWPTPAVRRWVEEAADGFGPEVILFGAPYPLAALGPALRRRLGVPYGVLAHGAEVAVPAALPVARQLIAGPLRRADVVFTNSRATTRTVERLLRRPAHHLGVGVDLATFRPAPCRARGRPVVGTVSRFVPRKRQADVIRAVATLRARGHDVEMLVVGRGRLERALRRLAARLAVPARFEIDVPWDRLPDLYRGMDVFALPCRSRWLGLEAEGLGIVFLEAAASGLPVVAGDSGGAPETVERGVTGFVVQSRRDLVEALELLVADRRRAAAMGAEGRARMEREYAWAGVIERLMAGLEDATSGVDRPPTSPEQSQRLASRTKSRHVERRDGVLVHDDRGTG